MITKGIQREAKLAVNYVLKHFYSARLPKLSLTPPPERHGYVIFFNQQYDFDLINYLCITLNAASTYSSGETAKIRIYVADVLKKTINLPADDGENDSIIDCSSIEGEQSLKMHFWVKETNSNNFDCSITNLGFYPTLTNPNTEYDEMV